MMRPFFAGGIIVIAIVIVASGCGGPAHRRGSAPEGVSFLVTPSDAEVLVDNVVRGKASDFPDEHPLNIAVGGHLLELRAPDHVSYVRKLAVSPQAKRIEATLLRTEGAIPTDGRNGNGGAK